MRASYDREERAVAVMSKMPIRRREHVLADQAVEAFKLIFPTHWIYRERLPDYGVDGEVELVSDGVSSLGVCSMFR